MRCDIYKKLSTYKCREKKEVENVHNSRQSFEIYEREQHE